jgi:hypothetical protein
MDPITITMATTIATQAIQILTPLFSKASEAFASKFGEDAYQASKHLYQIVQDHFAKQNDGGKASKILQNFADDPEEYRPNLENKLIPLLQADPEFAKQLSQTLQTGPIQDMDFAEDATVEDTHMNNELGQGSQKMKAGNRANFKNVSMNIGPKKEEES